ncbi:MAG: polysaccharide biosynthesis tyrosine autokinase [Phycisphaerales bacterium JB059]
MSSLPAQPASVSSQGMRRPGSNAPAPASQAPAVAIDPIKLARKYMWLGVAAVVVGVILGVGSFFVLKKFAPKYTSEVIFQCLPPEDDPSVREGTGDEDEMERFMLSQVSRMVSEPVFERIAGDPRLGNEAGTFAKTITVNGVVDRPEAVEELSDVITARIMPGTNYISMSAKQGNPTEAAALAKLAKEAYLFELRRSSNEEFSSRKDSIKQQIDAIEQEIADLNSRRARIVSEEGIDAIEQNQTEASQNLSLVVGQYVLLTQAMETAKVRVAHLEEMLKSEAGITYTDTQRAITEQNAHVATLVNQLQTLETSRRSLQQRGVLPGHRAYKRIEAQIAATRQELEDTREEELLKLFNAELDNARQTLAQYRAQEVELLRQREDLRLELTDLTRILADIDDLDARINQLITSRTELEVALRSVTATGVAERGPRVQVIQHERLPNRVSFPKLAVMVPAGVLLTLSLVAGLVVVREVLDQRVKSPADVAMIPRTRVLGMIPSASEDPLSPDSIETVFRDEPRSILAESFRQIRTPLLKKMQRAGHRSLLLVSGMPGSGATSVATNLAFACAAAEQRVLIIDANFRRSSVHRIFAQGEAPGLSDVLAGAAALSKVARKTDTERVDILPAGSREHRVFERLGSEKMSELLAEASSDYDLVLIDASPAIVSGDAVALANRVDATVLVVRAFNEKRGMVARLRNELGDARGELLGVVVNAVRSAAGGYMRKNIRTSHAYQSEDSGEKAAND